MKYKATMLLLFVIEIAVGLFAGFMVAMFVVPFCYADRGYLAVGSEWILIMFVAYIGFMICNKYIFTEIERSIKMPYFRKCEFCDCNLDPGEVCDCQKKLKEGKNEPKTNNRTTLDPRIHTSVKRSKKKTRSNNRARR